MNTLLILALNPAFAGDAEITLKFDVASMAAALDEADPTAGWIAVPADPLAAKTKADILIESLGAEIMVVSYDPGLLRSTPWGLVTEGTHEIFAVNNFSVGRGSGLVEEVVPFEVADIAAPATLTWADVAAGNAGFLVVDVADGSAAVVLPALTLELTKIEPEEID